jgi:Rod binding domain-containing protein
MVEPVVALAPPVADPATRAKIEKTASAFEASFLQVMLNQMFENVGAGAFGGGSGEAAFKSFLTDAFAQSMTERGGVGLSKDLTAEMLKMQGLS